MEGKIGFCAEYHNQDYKCANCGHCETKTKMTNFYEHTMVDWSDEVCSECGFKSLKPIPLAPNFSEEDLEEIASLLKPMEHPR